uniref:cytochrome c heme attachment protein n=1 Tax=Terniopsis heterostaminata TaxID=2060756 RepID=UPI0028D34B00|nr:cytochrome c heme attachment protein [Terniopsis heterostaminata]WMV01974.1 cytochrome c heme attachment protein [Terniopsis heterostaminata]
MIFVILEHLLTHISFSVILIVITIEMIKLLIDDFVELSDSSKKGMITTFFCITGLLITRWIYLGHLPLSNLYESLIFLSWIFCIIHMIPFFQKQNKWISTLTAPSAFLAQGFTTSGFVTTIHQSEILLPALQSQWLMMHVSMMVLGYAALLCGSLLAVALLVIEFPKKIINGAKSNHLVNTIFAFGQSQYNPENQQSFKEIGLVSSINFYRFQLIQQLDLWGYRIISIGFIFLTIGILSGAVWANEAWGSYWSWDPKETWAFITWATFSIYFHIRKSWEGFNSAIVASIGFLIIWICYFGVNLFAIGLHSYGSFTLTSL